MKIYNDNFEEIQEAKKERFEELAQKNKEKSDAEFKNAQKMGDVIPFGQPILLGHHSEKGDRNYRKKIERGFERGIENQKKSEYYNDKVNAIENNHAIRQDDPEALKKLKQKLATIEDQIEKVKTHNKNCKQIFLEAFGYPTGTKISNTNGNYKEFCFIFTDKTIERKDVINGVQWEAKRIPDEIRERIESYIKTGKFNQPELKEDQKKYDSYILQNLNGNKSSVKKRIEKIQVLEKLDDIDVTINKIRIYTEDGRVRVDFGYKPSEETRTTLKRSGFRWSPYNQVWQAYIHQHTIDKAKEIAILESEK